MSAFISILWNNKTDVLENTSVLLFTHKLVGHAAEQLDAFGNVAFVEIDGYCKQYELKAGQSIIIDTGYLAAMSESCTLDIETVKGARNIFLGGEGLFHTRVTGPGRVYIQSMPLMKIADTLTPYLPLGGNGDLNIKLGDN